MEKDASQLTIEEYLEEVKIWMVPIIVGLVIVVVGFLVLRPRFNAVLKNMDKRSQMRDQLAQLVSTIDQLEQLDTEQYQRRLVLLTTAVPSEPNPLFFLLSIDRLASQTGIDIESVNFSGLQKLQGSDKLTAGFHKLNIKLNFKGRSEQTEDFLRQLENYERLISIDDIQYDITGGISTSSGTFRGTLSLTTFFAPLPEKFGDTYEPLESFAQADEDILSKLEGRIGISPLGSSTRRSSTESAATRNPFR